MPATLGEYARDATGARDPTRTGAVRVRAGQNGLKALIRKETSLKKPVFVIFC